MALGSAFTVALTLKAIDEASKVITSMTGNATRQLVAMQAKLRAASETLTGFGKASMLTGAAAGAAMALPIKAYADLENAQADLTATTLKAGGVVSAQLSQVNALAVRLGTELPGTTTDLSRMMNTMLRLGTTEASILSGVGEAAAKLSVVIRVPYEQGAAAAAQLKEATGVADAQFVQFMDSIQRAVTLGVGLDELSYAFGRSTGALKTLNLQGLQSANDLNVMFAILVKILKSGERAGSNFSVLMNTIADKEKLGKANTMLAKYGITLDLFDRQTQQFKGVENLFAQFGQLQALKPLDLQAVLGELFGGGLDAQEAGLIVQQGVAGFRAMAARMREQATLTEKSAVILGTTTNLWDAASGTFTNAQATFTRAFAPEMKFAIGLFGSFSERLANFADRHQILAKIVGLSTLGLAGLAIGVGSVALGIGILLKGVDQAISGWQSLGRMVAWGRTTLQAVATVSAADRLRYLGIAPEATTLWGQLSQRITVTRMQAMQWTTAQWASARATILNAQWLRAQATTIGTTVWSGTVRATTVTRTWIAAQWAALQAAVANAGGLRALALTAGGTVVRSLWAGVLAARALTASLLATPIGWIGLAVAAAALLIYKFWGPIAGFFKGLWAGIVEGLQQLGPAWQIFRVAGALIWLVLTPLRWLWQAITWLVQPMEDAGGAAEAMGKRIGYWLTWPIRSLNDLATAMFTVGARLMESLWRGITSMASKPIEAVRSLAQSIRNLLPFSPAKDGPLRTLHQVRLVETIAESVRPAPLVAKMRQTAAAVALSVPMTVTPALAQMSAPVITQATQRTTQAIAAPPVATAAFGGAFSPTINITINGAEVGGAPQELAERVAQQTSLQIEKLMRRRYAI